MKMHILTYQDARSQMQVGDVIAFGGTTHLSEAIKFAIRAEVSHIGMIMRVPQPGSPEMIDATARRGVTVTALAAKLADYADVWWLPLRRRLRATHFDAQTLTEFLTAQVGKKYDHLQAVGSVLDWFDGRPAGAFRPGANTEDLTRLFCSELVAAGLKAAGLIPPAVNVSEVTPIDICRWQIYESHYYALQGAPAKTISGYNSLSRAYAPCL